MKNRHFTTVLILTLALSGCGGGGGDNPSTQPTITPIATSSGFASKGIVKSGKIVAQELNSQGGFLREVGNATTAADGAYSLTIGSNYGGGPVLFVLSATADTRMVCDVKPGCAKAGKNYGENMDVAPDFTLNAMVGNVTEGDKLTVQITPFTHMATHRALTLLAALPSGTTPAKAVDEANSEVNNLFGGNVDILRSRARDITKPSDLAGATPVEKVYAILNSAIGKLALDASGPGLTQALLMLANSFKEGKIKADEGVVPDNNRYSLKEILDAAKAQRAALALTDDSGVLVDLEQKIITAGTGDVDPEPSPLAGYTKIAKAKGLIQELRTWGNQIQTLEGPAKAFAEEAKMADAATRQYQGPLGKSLVNGVVLMLSVHGRATSVTGTYGAGTGTYDLNEIFGAGFVTGSGNITVISTSGQTMLRLVGTLGLAGESTLETLDLGLTLPTSNSTLPVASLLVGLAGTIENSGAKLTLTEGSVTTNFNPPITPQTGIADIEHALQSAGLHFKATFAEKRPDQPASFTGETQFDVVRCGACLGTIINPAFIKLSGALNKGAQNLSATVQADVSNASSFDFNQREGGNNVAKGALTVSLSAKLNSLPEAQFTLVVNRKGYDAITDANLGDASLTIAHSGKSTRIEASKLDTAPGTVNLTFTNQDGVKIVASGVNSAQEGNVTLDGTQLGKIRKIGGIYKVTYSDGTFETLN